MEKNIDVDQRMTLCSDILSFSHSCSRRTMGIYNATLSFSRQTHEPASLALRLRRRITHLPDLRKEIRRLVDVLLSAQACPICPRQTRDKSHISLECAQFLTHHLSANIALHSYLPRKLSTSCHHDCISSVGKSHGFGKIILN